MSYKAGDIVIIDRKVDRWSDDSWTPEMDKFIGKRAVIVSARLSGSFRCSLVEGGPTFNFPRSCFKIPLKQKEDKFKVRDIVTHKDSSDFFRVDEVSSNKISLTNLKDGSTTESPRSSIKLFYRYCS